ncbi:MAG: phosphatase PAP2 family protein [Phycisphaerae bacterium]|nr:phosphatase PAP2 family protein [Saprospiraceae bacterium]
MIDIETFRAFALSLFILASSQLLQAQKTYTLHWNTDLALGALGLGTSATGWAFGKKVKPLQPAELALLNRNDVFVLDRKATYLLSDKADRASNVVFYAATLVPALLLADSKIRKESGVISVLYLETLTLNGGLTEMTKNLAKRPRPYTYNPDFPLKLKQRRDARKSFFSGHTSSTAASCFFAAKVWSDFHPGNKWKPAVWAAAASIPAVTGYFRIRAGRHFFTDVATGYAVGATVGWLVPYLHHAPHN